MHKDGFLRADREPDSINQQHYPFEDRMNLQMRIEENCQPSSAFLDQDGFIRLTSEGWIGQFGEDRVQSELVRNAT